MPLQKIYFGSTFIANHVPISSCTWITLVKPLLSYIIDWHSSLSGELSYHSPPCHNHYISQCGHQFQLKGQKYQGDTKISLNSSMTWQFLYLEINLHSWNRKDEVKRKWKEAHVHFLMANIPLFLTETTLIDFTSISKIEMKVKPGN